jgi:SAM-dependent methyltransferase
MKSVESWQPTKFVQTAKGLRASRDPKQVIVRSRFIADIQASSYDRALRIHARGRLLDMGCGQVPLYGVYRDLVQESVCIDWANTIHPCKYLDFVVDLGGKLPFEDEKFDTILLTDVLEHLAEPVLAMGEIARILRPDGKVIVGVPFFYWIHEAPHDYYRYTEFALRRMCRVTGLDVIDLQAYGGLPEILCDLTLRSLDNLPFTRGKFVRPFQALASLLDATQFAKKISEHSKPRFPLGYLVVAQKKCP